MIHVLLTMYTQAEIWLPCVLNNFSNFFNNKSENFRSLFKRCYDKPKNLPNPERPGSMDFSNSDITMCNHFLVDDFNPLYNKEWSPTFQNNSQSKNNIPSSAGPVILQIPRSNGFKDNDFLLSPMDTSPDSDKKRNSAFQNILKDSFVSMETETSDHKVLTTQHQYQKDIKELNRCFNSKEVTGSNTIGDLTKDLLFIDPPILSTEQFSYFIVVQQSSVSNCEHVFENKRPSRKCLFQPQTLCKDKESDFFEGFRPV